jgi:hypothetical protein
LSIVNTDLVVVVVVVVVVVIAVLVIVEVVNADLVFDQDNVQLKNRTVALTFGQSEHSPNSAFDAMIPGVKVVKPNYSNDS